MNKTILVAALITLSGCTAIKRSLIRTEFRKTFAATETPGAELQKLGDGFYSYRWESYRTAFVATRDGVVVFDPLNDDAARGLAQAIQQVAPNPEIKYVIYSHYHRDHASGARMLPGHPKILAHAEAARDLQLHGFDDVLPPTEVFSDEERDLTVGGVTLRLIHVVKSHTDGLLMIYLPSYRALYEVDIVWPEQLPPPGSPDMSFLGVRRATEQMMALDFDLLVPGHAAVAKKADVVEYHQFLVDLEGAFRASLKMHQIGDLHRKETFERGARQLADVFFDVEDALRPRYGRWVNFDTGILSVSQWCFWGVLIGW